MQSSAGADSTDTCHPDDRHVANALAAGKLLAAGIEITVFQLRAFMQAIAFVMVGVKLIPGAVSAAASFSDRAICASVALGAAQRRFSRIES